jgi:hypothetical protein
MSRRPLLALALACLMVTAGCSFLGPNPDSHTSSYDYTVGIDADATLEDVTVRVPLPQVDGATVVDAAVAAPNGTVEAFAATVVETDHGPMLELTAETFAVETRYYRFVERDGLGRREEISESAYDPADPNHRKVDRRTVGVTVSVAADYPLDTRTPVGAEPMFYAADAVTREPTACELPYRDASACLAYDAPVYLAYDAPAGASVEGSVTFAGRNEWFAGGWTGNEYTDRVRFGATGPQDGWATGDGYTELGRGSYPTPER